MNAAEARAILWPVRNRVGWVVFLLAPLGCSSNNGDGDFSYSGTTNQVIPGNFGGDLLADVQVMVNNTPQKLFTIDTGAPFTILNAPSFPDHTDGVHQDTLYALFLTFPNLTDISIAISTDKDGIFGGNILTHFAFSLDYAGNRIWLGDPYDPETIPRDVSAGAETTVAFDILGGGTASTGGNCNSNCIFDYSPTRALLKAQIEDQAEPVWVLIDSGASVVVLQPALFNSLTADPNRPMLQGVKLVAVTGSQESFLSRVSRIKLIGTDGASAPVDIESLEIGVIPSTDILDAITKETGKPVQALLGATYLRYFLTTVDYQSKKLRLRRYTDAHVDPNEFIGPGFALQQVGQAWELGTVYTNKDAYAQGLREGQVVEEIGNQPITGQPNSAVHAIMSSYALGEEMPVTVVQDGTMVTVNVLVQDLLPTYPAQ